MLEFRRNGAAPTNLQSAREKLFQNLRREIRDEMVLQAMERVPRELFVPLESRPLAYEDAPLPIGEEQSISQPYIIALMTLSLDLKGTEKVLEVGTGSGYQAAVLAELAARVISVERIPALAERARRLLKLLGYTNVEVHLSGRTLGLPAEAPYDAILVTAGAPTVPPPLLYQLAQGGRMVIPVGLRFEQELLVLRKEGDRLERRNLGPCRFVPLIGEEAWPEGEA